MSVVEALRRILSARGGYTVDQVVNAALRLAVTGDMRAIEYVTDRIDGRVPQSITATIDIEQRIIEVAEREGVDPEEAVATAQRIIREAQ